MSLTRSFVIFLPFNSIRWFVFIRIRLTIDEFEFFLNKFQYIKLNSKVIFKFFIAYKIKKRTDKTVMKLIRISFMNEWKYNRKMQIFRSLSFSGIK